MCCLLVSLLSCARKQEDTTNQWDAETSSTILEQGANWIVFSDNANNYSSGFAVYSDEGDEVFWHETFGRDPEFFMISGNLLRVDLPAGTGMRHTWFFDLEQGLVSPMYSNILTIGYGKVAHQPLDMLVVQNIFDVELFYAEFELDSNSWLDLSLDAQEQVLFMSAFRSVEFIDENHLLVEFYNTYGELTQKTFELRAG